MACEWAWVEWYCRVEASSTNIKNFQRSVYDATRLKFSPLLLSLVLLLDEILCLVHACAYSRCYHTCRSSALTHVHMHTHTQVAADTALVKMFQEACKRQRQPQALDIAFRIRSEKVGVRGRGSERRREGEVRGVGGALSLSDLKCNQQRPGRQMQ